MKISDQLFIYLLHKCSTNNNDVENYVNTKDHNIYLVKDKNSELYFVIGGSFILDADNEIRYDKTDRCIFVRNANTDKVKAINPHKIKKCLECVTIEDFALELLDFYEEYQQYKNEKIIPKKFEDVIQMFYNQYKNLMKQMRILDKKKDEDIIEYCKRLVSRSKIIETTKQYIDVKKYIEQIWIQTLYEPTKIHIVEAYLTKVITRLIKSN